VSISPRVEGSGDQNFGINDVLLEITVGTFLAARDHKFVALGFEPLLDAKLVLNSAEEAGLFLSGLSTVVEDSEDLHF
jgi:hypothetical protein